MCECCLPKTAWHPTSISAVCIVFSLYAVLWSLVIAAWAVFISFAACAAAFIALAPVLAVTGKGLAGLVLIGAALICAGLAIFSFFGSRGVSKGVYALTKLPFRGIGRAFAKGGAK